ncbi:hypothetical protein B0H14DRAFT_2575236 [Mycena olivaceomarginata]|nr:hypothetical protein B0H14DRAFT_2575236 [Mycena olivaceomarginata]
MANSSYANISGLMLFENPRKVSKKVTALDVFVFIGPAEENSLMGAVRHFNNAEQDVVFEAGFYSCQIRVVKMETGFDVYNDNAEQYSFVGDLKAFSGPVDVLGPYRVYVHILGTVTKSFKEEERFEMEAEQYTLAHSDAKTAAEEEAKKNGTSVATAVAAVPRSIFRVTGFFGNSQRYKNKKPIPFPNKVALIGGFLAGTTEELDATGTTKINQRFLVEVDEVTFVNPAQAPNPAPKFTPSPSGSGSGSGSRFSNYAKKRPRTEDSAPTSSPSPATQ